MKTQTSLFIGLCLFCLAYSAKTGKVFFPDKVQKVATLPPPQAHAPLGPVSNEPDSITIEIPSNAENVKREGDIQKINYEPDKGRLTLEYQKRLIDHYYWPIPMGFGYGYAYPPPSAYQTGYNGLGASNYANGYAVNPNNYNVNGLYSYPSASSSPYDAFNYNRYNGYNYPYNTNSGNQYYGSPYGLNNMYPYTYYGNNQYDTYLGNNLYNTYPYTSTGNSYGAYGPYGNLYSGAYGPYSNLYSNQ